MNIIPDIKGIIKYLNLKEKLIKATKILGSIIFLVFLWATFFFGYEW